MTRKEVIQTLIDDYSKQAKLSKRERTIFEHGLLTGIQIGSIEEPEVDLEKGDAIDIEGICSDKDFIDTKHGILAFGAEEGSYRPFNDGDKVKIIITKR